MATTKRAKELARAKYERQQERRAQGAAARRKRQRVIGIVVAAVVVAGGLVWAGLSMRTSDTVATPDSSADSAAATPSAEPTPGSDAAEQTPLVAGCEPAGTPRQDTLSWPTAPDVSESTPTTLTLATNCGDIVIALDAAAAPQTVASEAFLAAEGFYDATTCHRLTTGGIFVLQCGDPKGDGTGGPGYSVPDENLPAEGEANYPAGTVAMANAGPGTSGSQFFIVYEDTTLPSGYTIWGTVTAGLDLVKQVAAAGVEGGATDGRPAQPVFIESATVS